MSKIITITLDDEGTVSVTLDAIENPLEAIGLIEAAKHVVMSDEDRKEKVLPAGGGHCGQQSAQNPASDRENSEGFASATP